MAAEVELVERGSSIRLKMVDRTKVVVTTKEEVNEVRATKEECRMVASSTRGSARRRGGKKLRAIKI